MADQRTDADVVADYLAARAEPWRLVGRYEQALIHIRQALDSGSSMGSKLQLIRQNVDAADVPDSVMGNAPNGDRS
ncbi:hypothetical protein VH570_19465 [Sphingobium sp. HT1-2]|uniref:hypothetical protein n=1 Tax=Sphingobium sp. HT1-2 TaxID=3111640 RepID=UPI003C0C36AC